MFGHGDRDTLTTRNWKADNQIGVRKAKAPLTVFQTQTRLSGMQLICGTNDEPTSTEGSGRYRIDCMGKDCANRQAV
jgi:hypothetical protein